MDARRKKAMTRTGSETAATRKALSRRKLRPPAVIVLVYQLMR
jgi:hypothetical protein